LTLPCILIRVTQQQRRSVNGMSLSLTSVKRLRFSSVSSFRNSLDVFPDYLEHVRKCRLLRYAFASLLQQYAICLICPVTRRECQPIRASEYGCVYRKLVVSTHYTFFIVSFVKPNRKYAKYSTRLRRAARRPSSTRRSDIL